LEEVRDLFKKMHSKVLEEGAEEADLSPEFLEMRLLTNNYDVPADGCETYAATYRMLKEADQAYHETR
jgi:regulator of cell morphogenesis and NO signaling